MAVNLSSGQEENPEQPEMNVTPFIDVVLVLLIIFMVAAPLSTVDVAVDLPTTAAPKQPRPDKPVYVTLKSDRTIAVGEKSFSRDALGLELDRATSGSKEQRIYLRADKTVAYGDLMQLMNLIRAAGYLKVGLVTLEDAQPAARQ